MVFERLDYAAGQMSAEQRAQFCAWMRSETPDISPHGVFLSEIVRENGTPVRVTHHRFAEGPDGFYIVPGTEEVAKLDPLTVNISSEPFPDDPA